MIGGKKNQQENKLNIIDMIMLHWMSRHLDNIGLRMNALETITPIKDSIISPGTIQTCAKKAYRNPIKEDLYVMVCCKHNLWLDIIALLDPRS